ncbi:hypothetical protein ACFX15_039408 [Malus domestica]
MMAIWLIELRLGTVELPGRRRGSIISQSSLIGGVESPEPEPGSAVGLADFRRFACFSPQPQHCYYQQPSPSSTL